MRTEKNNFCATSKRSFLQHEIIYAPATYQSATLNLAWNNPQHHGTRSVPSFPSLNYRAGDEKNKKSSALRCFVAFWPTLALET
jgi:hypothetical protein